MKPTFLSTSVGAGSTEAVQVGRLFTRARPKLHGWQSIVFTLTLGVAMSACASTTWKEEVALHDGSKIIVTRSQNYGGRHEIGQSPPIKEQAITFTVPTTKKTLTFKSEFSEDIGRANFNLLALHILNDTPYLVASPNLCLSYNKWGRPNPPYVIFQHDGKTWQRIPLSEFPAAFKDINLVISTKNKEKILTAEPFVTTERVRKVNGNLTQPEFKTILREAVAKGTVASSVNCEEMIHYKCGWFGTSPDGKFNKEFADRMCNK